MLEDTTLSPLFPILFKYLISSVPGGCAIEGGVVQALFNPDGAIACAFLTHGVRPSATPYPLREHCWTGLTVGAPSDAYAALRTGLTVRVQTFMREGTEKLRSVYARPAAKLRIQCSLLRTVCARCMIILRETSYAALHTKESQSSHFCL